MSNEHLLATEIAIFAAAVIAAGLLMWAIDVYYNRWNRRWRAGWEKGLRRWEHTLEMQELALEDREHAVAGLEVDLRQRIQTAAMISKATSEQIEDETVLRPLDWEEYERSLNGDNL